jgi:hypothetical protein
MTNNSDNSINTQDYEEEIQVKFNDKIKITFNFDNMTGQELMQVEAIFDSKPDYLLMDHNQTDTLIQKLIDIRRVWPKQQGESK